MPIVAPIDYETVEPVAYKKTVAFVNTFVINTTEFLNRFVYVCEQKLQHVHRHIQRLEITMNILECKLSSIPGLENVPASAPTAVDQQAGPSQEGSQAPPPPPPPPDASMGSGIPGPEDEGSAEPPPPPAGPTIKDDPRYAKYFKMLNMRIPAAAIRQKMMMEGVDPNILDNPDAPLEGGMETPSDSAAALGFDGEEDDDYYDDDFD